MCFLKRNLITISILTVITGAISTYWAFTNLETSYQGTIFTTIANQSSSSSSENEQASTYFGETLMGWFRNPALLNKIFEQSQVKGGISAHKQERQNLIIELDAPTTTELETLSQTTLEVLNQEIEQFNQKTKNQFQLVSLGTSVSPAPLQRMVLILAGLISGFLGAYGLIFLLEALFGKISFKTQITNLFPNTDIIEFNPKSINDNEYLATAYLKANSPVILAGIDFDSSDLTVSTSLKAGEITNDVILVDGDLKEKKLHLNLGLSDLMKNIKGLTDRIKKEEKLSKYVHHAIDKKLKFLAAGGGENVIWDDFTEQLEQHKTILVHTILPHNFPILNLEKISLFLFVKLGVSRYKTLAQVKALNLKNVTIILVS